MRQEHGEHGLCDDLTVEAAVVDLDTGWRFDLEIIPAGCGGHDPFETGGMLEPLLLEVQTSTTSLVVSDSMNSSRVWQI